MTAPLGILRQDVDTCTVPALDSALPGWEESYRLGAALAVHYFSVD